MAINKGDCRRMVDISKCRLCPCQQRASLTCPALPQMPVDSVRKVPPGKDLSVFECEYIIVALMLEQMIAADYQFTMYE